MSANVTASGAMDCPRDARRAGAPLPRLLAALGKGCSYSETDMKALYTGDIHYILKKRITRHATK